MEEAKSLTIYRGLPHQLFDKEKYRAEMALGEWIKIEGYPFYTQPIVPEAPVAEAMTKIAGEESSFLPFSGEKRCGGFHPDWALTWQVKGKMASLLICWNCGEAILAWPHVLPRTHLRVDQHGAGWDAIAALLKTFIAGAGA